MSRDELIEWAARLEVRAASLDRKVNKALAALRHSRNELLNVDAENARLKRRVKLLAVTNRRLRALLEERK